MTSYQHCCDGIDKVSWRMPLAYYRPASRAPSVAGKEGEAVGYERGGEQRATGGRKHAEGAAACAKVLQRRGPTTAHLQRLRDINRYLTTLQYGTTLRTVC